MTTATFFLIGMAVLVAAVLILAAFSGRMRKDTRGLIVRLAVGLFYPFVVLVSAQTAWGAFAEGDWLVAVLNALVVIGITIVGIQMWRNPTLRPATVMDDR